MTLPARAGSRARAQAPVSDPEPVRRTEEIEELTNRHLIHPAAARLVPLLARMHVTPNAVSLAGLLFGVLAACAYYHYHDPRFAAAGLVLMIAWHIMDGADGQLARLTRSQSQLGKVLDGLSDSVTFLAVYTALASALGAQSGGWMYVLVAVSGVCHLVQSAAYEKQRQEYDVWAWGKYNGAAPSDAPGSGLGAPGGQVPAARAAGAHPPGARASSLRRALDFLDRLFYECLSFPAAGVTRRFHAAMAATLARQPERTAEIRQRYRAQFAPLLRRWSILSANYRTLGIFIGALLGAPQYYFAFEIVGFSAILGVLIHWQSACAERFLATLDEPA